MLGAALAAVQIGSSIIGGMKAANEQKKIINSLKAQKDQNEDWWDRKENEDPTQLASSQAIMTATEDAVRRRNRAAAGTQAVMGGTEESVAAAKAANNQITSDTASKIAVAGEQRKQALENQYLNRKEAIEGQINAARGQKAQAISGAIQGVGNAVGNIGLALDATAKTSPSSSVTEGKNGQLDTSAIVEQNQKALTNPFVKTPNTGKSRVTQNYMGNLQTNSIAAQNQAATAAWMDEMARRYGQSIWDAK